MPADLALSRPLMALCVSLSLAACVNTPMPTDPAATPAAQARAPVPTPPPEPAQRSAASGPDRSRDYVVGSGDVLRTKKGPVFDTAIIAGVMAAKRTHGYYVLPFLEDEAITARVDLKSDRQAGVLRVQAAWREPDATAETTTGLSIAIASRTLFCTPRAMRSGATRLVEEGDNLPLGDLSVAVSVKSEKDTLGASFSEMTDNLNTLVGYSHAHGLIKRRIPLEELFLDVSQGRKRGHGAHATGARAPAPGSVGGRHLRHHHA